MFRHVLKIMFRGLQIASPHSSQHSNANHIMTMSLTQILITNYLENISLRKVTGS